MKLKEIWIIFIASLFAFNIFAQEEKGMDKVHAIIKELKHKFAPDSRTAVFNINTIVKRDSLILKGETNLLQAKEELLQKLKGIKLIDQVEVLPDTKLGDRTYGIITLSVANLRTKPENQAEMASQALLGTPIRILKQKKDWFLIQTPDQYISWTENASLHRVDHDSLTAWDNAKKIIYTKDFGFAFSKPDENSERVSDLVIGDILRLSGEDGDFVKVIYPDGKEAFIKKEDCSSFKEWFTKADPTAENIIKTAKSFLGIPYLWGGTSAKGMDCSGFTKTVFFLYGMILPRDASQQVNIGKPVDTNDKLENLKPGDLLFFGSENPFNETKITHVAIYIGDGDFINASGNIRIDSFSKDKPNYSAYRDDSFVCARRILGSIDSSGVTTIFNNKFYNFKK